MKAAVLKSNGIVSYEDVDTPVVTPGNVRIRVAVCGICGSDVPRVFDNKAHSYPAILGHEFSGIVDSVGEGVTGLQVGDHVVAAPLRPCFTCPDCQRGDYALCSHYSFIGSREPGAMAEYVVVPAGNVVPISKDIPFQQAATIEPATVALHALRQAKFTAGKRVAVLGCGIIGLYVIQWAKLLGASSVTAIGRGAAGLKAAKEAGADRQFSTKDISEEALCAALDRGGYDYVFESSGATQTFCLTLQIVAKKGTICLIGTPKKDITFSIDLLEKINRKECWITGSWMSYSLPFPGEEWTMAVRAMEESGISYIPGLVYQTYPLSEAAEAFEAIHGGAAKGRVLLSNLK